MAVAHAGKHNLSQYQETRFSDLLNRPANLQDLRQRVRRDPRDAYSLHVLGKMLSARGEFRRSWVCHRAAAECHPEMAEFQYQGASAALAAGCTEEAARYLDKTVHLNPRIGLAWQKRGELYLDHFHQPEEAFQCFRRAMELEPQDDVNYLLAARCLLDGVGALTALARLRAALPSGADPLQADRSIAQALADAGCFEDAVPILLDILRQQPHDQASMRLVAELYGGMREWQTAQHWWEQAVAQGNDLAAWVGYMLFWPRLGDWERAREIYRLHLDETDFSGMRRNIGPPWHGEDVRGKTVYLIAGDMYLGDALQFVRFARCIKAAGARVIVQAPKRLRTLFSTAPGADSVVAPHDPVPPVDYETVAFWLLFAPQIPMKDVIHGEPYLHAPHHLRARWTQRIATPGINAGIVWRGSPLRIGDRYRGRSMRLEDLRPLAEIPGVNLYSLQYGPARKDLLTADPPFPAIDLAPDMENLAAAIAALDVVITIDTSIVHLAGGMGKRTLLMLPYDCCFRWELDRDDCPWYPSVRLFRQTKPGDWSSVVAAVARAVRQ